MSLRVGYLWLLLSVGSLFACYQLLSHQTLARFAVEQLGSDSQRLLVNQGSFALYWHSVGASVKSATPYVTVGFVIGLFCRGLWWIRVYLRQRIMRRTNRISDRYGGQLIMENAALDYDADNRELRGPYSLPDPTKLPPSTSPIERELFALYHHFRAIPADVAGFHGRTLFEHSVAAWDSAVKRHGAGSMQAMLALAHDAGKLLAYEQTITGQWQRCHSHEILAMQVVRGLNAYLTWEPTARSKFLSLLTALVTGEIPVEFGESERAMLRELRSIDASVTHREAQAYGNNATVSESEQTPVLDAATVVQLVVNNTLALLDGINVNQSLDVSGAVEAIFIAQDEILYLPESTLRKRLAALLPTEISQELKLLTPNTKGRMHVASKLLGDVAQQLFDCVNVVGDKQARDGRFRVVWARLAWDSTFAIRTTHFPDKFAKTWGNFNYEIDIFTPSS